MSLRDLDLKVNYFSGEDDIVRDFYVPVLSETKKYDRMASFFSSSSLTAASLGFKKLIENEGHVRLLVNTQLDEKDVEVLKGERETKTKNIENLLDPAKAKDEEEKVRWKILAWMVDNDYLEIRICDVPEQGIFHPKIGILRDEKENLVVFSGSANESRHAWEYNVEDLDVYSSWKEGHHEFINPKIRRFEEIWENRQDYTETYTIPKAIKEDIIKISPPNYREIEEKSDQLPERKVEKKESPSDDWLHVIGDAGKAVGGTHVAEEACSIEPWPHQRIISDTLYTAYPKGFLLCDEVGLGKTIEAGLVLSRLIHTEEIQNALILVPANLVKQWQEELFEKFNLNTYIYTKPVSEHRYKMVDAWKNVHDIPEFKNDHAWSESPVWRFVHEKNNNEEPAIIIASWHLARMTDNQEIFVPDDDEMGVVRDKDNVEASCRGRDKKEREGVWDLVFVDEAHKARRREFRKIRQRGRKGTPNHLLKLLRRMKNHAQCMHLLTATPMQINSIELFDLLSLVGLPKDWNDPKNFLEFYQTRRAIQTVIEKKGNGYVGQAKSKNGKRTGQEKLESGEFVGKLESELELDRNEIKSYLFNAFKLARAYDKAQNGVYSEELEKEIETSKNREYIQSLLRDDSQFIGFTTEKERGEAVEKLSAEDWKIALKALKEAHPIDVILNRYTRDTLRDYRKRGLLDKKVPARKVKKQMIDLGKAESIYDKIKDYVQDFYKKAVEGEDERSRAVGIVMTTYRQRMTSSFRAIRKSLTNRMNELARFKERVSRETEDPFREGDDIIQERMATVSTDEVEDLIDSREEREFDSFDLEIKPDNIDRYISSLETEITALETFVEEVQNMTGDPKLERLRKDIREINRKGRDRIMIFTQFTDTLDAIRDSLVSNFGAQVGCYSGRGGEIYTIDGWKRVDKEKVKTEFKDDNGDIEILVCTEAASHGLNLQRCGVVINYDLPWNPMRVEQRIGRIDRIGQEFDKIWIYNYYYESTVDTDIYEALEDRLNIFHEYIGGMQPILASVKDQIHKAAMEGEQEELEGKETDENYEYLSEVVDTVERDKLNGWDDYIHPDIGRISVDPSYPYESPVKNNDIEEIITSSGLLEEKGIEIMRISGINLDSVYKVKIPSEKKWSWISEIYKDPEEGTKSDKIITDLEETYEFAVTFDPEISQEYPSIRLMSFGEPLFEKLVDVLLDKRELLEMVNQIKIDREGKKVENDNWLVCGWMDEKDTGSSLRNIYDLEELEEWARDKKKLDKMS